MKKSNIILFLIIFIGILIIFGIVFFYEPDNKNHKTVVKWGEIENEVKTTETREILYEYAPLPTDGKTSYWFIVAQEKEAGLMLNSFIKQDHSYFSYDEALSSFGDPSKYFLLNFEEVSEATYIEANK